MISAGDFRNGVTFEMDVQRNAIRRYVQRQRRNLQMGKNSLRRKKKRQRVSLMMRKYN